MALPYSFVKSLQGTEPILDNMELDVSLTLVDGTPLKWNATTGKLTPITTNTDRPLFILNGAALTTALGSQANQATLPTPSINQIGNGYNSTKGPCGNQIVDQLGGYADIFSALNGLGIWRCTFTPFLSNIVSAATGSPTSISLPNSTGATINANQLQGGTIFCASLQQQVQITANASATNGSQCVITTVAPLGQNGLTINADGLVFSATPLGRGMANIKFSTASGTVANSGYVPSQTGVGTSDFAGGFIQVYEVDIQGGQLHLIFN